MLQPPVIAARTTLIPLWEQIVMYFGIVIGTIVSALLRGTIQVANPNNRLWVVIGLSCFIGLITMPYIYEKTRPDRLFWVSGDKPGLCNVWQGFQPLW
jgi:hypothetical protein